VAKLFIGKHLQCWVALCSKRHVLCCYFTMSLTLWGEYLRYKHSHFLSVERMRSNFLKTAVAVALVATVSGTARAEDPSLAGFNVFSTSFIAPAGTTAFSTTFLYGIAGNTNTLFYRVGAAGAWDRILAAVGATPNATTNPPVGFSVSKNVVVPTETEIFFALCQGDLASFASCGAGGTQGPFLTGAGSTNVRVLEAAQWNAIRPPSPQSADATLGEFVFGFEDVNLAGSDEDFNDVVFSTSLVSRSVVPEPASLALVLVGFAGLVGARARRKSA
jgi:hypothetical protein